MTLKDWFDHTRRDVKMHGWRRGLRYGVDELGIGFNRRFGKRFNYGNVWWERDWDVLVILDACRPDLLRDVSPEYDIVPDDFATINSPASMSLEWLYRHVKPEYYDEIRKTALVSGNVFTREDFVRDAPWETLDDVWFHSWDDEEGTVLPRSVTNAAIRRHRNGDHDRMIVWYLQPHVPFIPADWCGGFTDRERFGNPSADSPKSVWFQLRDQEISHEKVWSAYLDNLRYVLEEVGLLLENINGWVTVTSDHGNGMGEWGVWGHPRWSWAPCVKRVPRFSLTAVDERTHTPPPEPSTNTDTSVEERLQALGYAD